MARDKGARHARSPDERRRPQAAPHREARQLRVDVCRGAGEELRPAGGAARVEFTGEFYVGLGVSAHDTARIETGAFSNVELGTPPPATGRTTLVNTLETISLRSKDRRVALRRHAAGRIEAPNWFPDATNTLYFNTGGKLYKVQADPPGTPPNPNRLKTPEAGRPRHPDAHQQRSRRHAWTARCGRSATSRRR